MPVLRLGRRAEAGHQPGRVPRRTAGEPVALEHDDVGPALVGEVVGDRAPDHAATDDDDAGPVGQLGESHRHNLASPGVTGVDHAPAAWLARWPPERLTSHARPAYAVGKQVRTGVRRRPTLAAYDERT